MKSKKTLSLLLALILALSLLPLPRAAAEEKCTVRFDSNLVTEQRFAPIEVPKGTALKDVELPEPWGASGWRFDGWSKYPSGWDRKIDLLEPVNEDLKLYAVWLRLLDEATVYVPTPTAGWSPRNTEDPAWFGWWNYYEVEPGSWWAQIEDVGHPEQAFTDTFEAGKTYYGSLRIIPDGGLFVQTGYESTEVTLVGDAELMYTEVVETEDGEALNVVYSVTVPEQSKIDHAELFVDRIVSYASADRFCRRACLSSGLSIEPIDTWWANEADVEDYSKKLQPSDGLLPGQTYYSYYMLFADEDAEIDYDNFTATIYGGKFLGMRKDEDAYEPTIIVYYSVDVLEVYGMTVLLEPGWINDESPGAYLDDLDPRWESYIDGPSVPAGERSFTAKARQGYVFEGWYEAEVTENLATTGKETLLTHSATLVVQHDRYQRIHCRFAVDPTTLSDLVVCGVAVTDENAADILGDGVFSYDAGTKTLNVHGSVSYYGSILQSRVQGLTVNVSADSSLTETEESGAIELIQLRGDTVITGAGKLTIHAENAPFCVSVLNNAKLTLDGLRAAITCPQMGICGDEANEALVIRACELDIRCKPERALAVDFFGSVTLEDCRVSYPKNARIEQGAILNSAGHPAPKVVITTGYGGNFADVPPESYYAEPVSWAVVNEITNGKSETSFAPADDCSRAQIVTFLWRASGRPAPDADEAKKGPGNPFVDVKDGAYYADAVLWAVENGITNGKDEMHFAPNESCTRGQAVTFLWRAKGEPAPDKTENPFVDVESGKFYYDAVLWAFYHDPQITNGVDPTHFEPGKTCSRSQIVTFLWRSAGCP